ncbi:MAG: hypothetical protein KatS3mg087_0410 [Patescibacteria group bacterium]|nr:MAG: hypothetical protein KatS3mg087_0410 [Patescibacteria group bacterium]
MKQFFQKNEGTTDRAIRIVAGIVALVAAYMNAGVPQLVLGVVGAALVGTGVTGFCGLYRLFGISTCPVKPLKKHECDL